MICERCGKIISGNYGSGRFCSRSCANKRNFNIKTKLKISNKLIEYGNYIRNKNKTEYNKNPKICTTCGKSLSYEDRKNNFCSKECLSKHLKEVNSNWVKYHNGKLKNQFGNFIVYKVICTFDDTYYIGVHKINNNLVNDNYLGSGKIITSKVKKYGKEKFQRITLKEFNNSNDAYKYESELVNKYIKDKNCLNLSFGGIGGFGFIGKHHTKETKNKIRNSLKRK